jgi:hypothetical protein
MTMTPQLVSKLVVVVDLAIEAQDVPAGRRFHGLVSLMAEVDDGEPAMTERHTGRGITPHTMIVRTSVCERGGHIRSEPQELVGG